MESLDNKAITEKLAAIDDWLRTNTDVIDTSDCEFLFVTTMPSEIDPDNGVDATFTYCMSQSSRLHACASILYGMYEEFLENTPEEHHVSFDLFVLQSLDMHSKRSFTVYDEDDEEEDDDESYD